VDASVIRVAKQIPQNPVVVAVVPFTFLFGEEEGSVCVGKPDTLDEVMGGERWRGVMNCTTGRSEADA
jgi:hypothetical protein